MQDVIRRQQRHTVAACYLGWTLDAFDYFIMAFALDDVATTFHATRTTVTWAFTLTLAMRPLGAFVFGRIADRFGRRPTLMANVLLYSVIEAASGFAPTLTTFLILRAVFGLAMGGEWGVGASLTMESIPARWRGPVSGLLQAGYPSGYLLATILNQVAIAHVGWRGLFWLGVAPAVLVYYIRRNVPESPDWTQRTASGQTSDASPIWYSVLLPLAAIAAIAFGVSMSDATLQLVLALLQNPMALAVIVAAVAIGGAAIVGQRQYWGLALYAIAMMAAFNFFSHGTQDLYKSFLTKEHGLKLPTATSILIAMNIAAIVGGIVVGSLSQQFGRRPLIVAAALCSLPVLPLWAFASNPLWIGVGAFLMQLCVQGAWGVIPAHLNELSPPSIRATFPGFTYQLGNLVAAGNATLQSSMADRYFHGNLAWPLVIVVGTVAIVIAVLVGLGREARDVRMGREAVPA